MRHVLIVIGCATALLSSSVLAHTAWLVPVKSAEPETARYQVYFGGHEGKLEPYPAEKVKSITAVDTNGTTLTVSRTNDEDKVQVQIDGTPALVLMHFDNGIYTRTGAGDGVNVPMSAVDGALSAVRAVKYHKTIAAWTELVTKAQGQPFEVVPLSAAPPRAGQPFAIRVLVDGRPAAGIQIGTGEDTGDAVTNAEGVAQYRPVAGFNQLWAGQRQTVTDNPDYTEFSVEYLLTFNAK